MREQLEKLQDNLRNLGYEEKMKFDDFGTLDEFRELARGISDSSDEELRKLDTMLYEARKNARFTRFSEVIQDMIEIKSAEREGWEKILDTINFLSY